MGGKWGTRKSKRIIFLIKATRIRKRLMTFFVVVSGRFIMQ